MNICPASCQHEFLLYQLERRLVHFIVWALKISVQYELSVIHDFAKYRRTGFKPEIASQRKARLRRHMV